MVGEGSAGVGPRVVTSKRRIVYRRSAWSALRFELRSGAGGDLLCRAEALRMQGSLLLWLGGSGSGAGEAGLGAVALAMPAGGSGAGERALSSLLLPNASEAAGEAACTLARRLTTALARPVYVCCSLELDRFTAPLVHRGIMMEIKNRPDFFS